MWGIFLQDNASRDLHITVQAKFVRIRSPLSSGCSNHTAKRCLA